MPNLRVSTDVHNRVLALANHEQRTVGVIVERALTAYEATPSNKPGPPMEPGVHRQAVVQKARRTAKGRTAAQADAIRAKEGRPPVVEGAVTDGQSVCPHPQESEQVHAWGVTCGVCHARLR